MDTTLAAGHPERVRGRLAAALALSIACHVAAALVLGRGFGDRPPPRAPIVVTMLERGSGAAGGMGAAGSAAAPAVAAPPAAAPAPAMPPAPATAARGAETTPRVRARTVPPVVERGRREVAKPARPEPVAPPPRVPPSQAAVGAGAPAVAGPAAVSDGAVAGAGSAGAAGEGTESDAGAGTGAGGAGRGAHGTGAGGDGLRAYCRSCPAPDYPPRARRQGWQGTVDVALRIARDGSVTAASVARSSGHHALDDVALASARASRFAVPAGERGLDGRIRYRFVLDARAGRR